MTTFDPTDYTRTDDGRLRLSAEDLSGTNFDGADLRGTVLHLGGREICAEDARDMGLTAGAIVEPREWAVLPGHSGRVWGRVG